MAGAQRVQPGHTRQWCSRGCRLWAASCEGRPSERGRCAPLCRCPYPKPSGCGTSSLESGPRKGRVPPDTLTCHHGEHDAGDDEVRGVAPAQVVRYQRVGPHELWWGGRGGSEWAWGPGAHVFAGARCRRQGRALHWESIGRNPARGQTLTLAHVGQSLRGASPPPRPAPSTDQAMGWQLGRQTRAHGCQLGPAPTRPCPNRRKAVRSCRLQRGAACSPPIVARRMGGWPAAGPTWICSCMGLPSRRMSSVAMSPVNFWEVR